MKRREKNVEEFVLRHMGLFKAPQEEIDLAEARIRKQLRSAPSGAQELPVESGAARHDWNLKGLAVFFAAAAAVVVVVFLLMPRGVEAYAAVETADGSLSRTSGDKTEVVRVGERVPEGDILRTNDGLGGIRLPDGTRVEMRAQSELFWETADDGARIRLTRGSVIVNAKDGTQRLYVQTQDALVLGMGSVFLVVAEEGSRVAVIQGEVQVRQRAAEKRLLAGEQVATNPLMQSLQIKEAILWSRNVEAHVALLQQSAPPQTTPTARQLEFEVASLRPVPDGRPTDIRCRGIDGAWSASFQNAEANAAPIPLGRCTGAFGLRQFVRLAFDIPQQRISGIELGMFEDVYQLEAKAEDPATATKAQLLQMIHNLVIDRFKLKTHIEMKEEQGYSLHIAEGGIKFKQTLDNEELTKRPPACPTCFDGKFTLKRFANGLEASPIFIGGPAVNKTGLKGVYEIKLTVVRPIDAFGGGARGGQRGPGGGPPPRPDFDPPLANALEQQLGLRLEAGKVQVEYLVVDQWERSTDN